MFPYPSGDKLHIGHWYNYGPVDTWGRFMKMKGYEVFQPMGFDSFGLPAENYAIKTGVHPAETTRTNIDKMKEQIAAIGGMYDLDLDLETSSPEYYKWTQWVFLQLYKKGLAERREAPVNWCTSCQTVLANEQVQGDGTCERCKNEVIQKNLTQWFFKITDYAEKLLDYEGMDWPQKTIAMQKNWIGKSQGVNIDFKMTDSDEVLSCYTTRPDTLYSVTFLVIAPEHPLVQTMIAGTEYEAPVNKVISQIKKQTDIERTSTGGKNKLGAYTGKNVVNPANGEEIPVYIANFALMYGTGVVMADAHDERDFEFAEKYDIPLKFVISEDGSPTDSKDVDEAYVADGILFDSGEFTGMNNREALPKMAEWMEKEGFGKRTTNYRLRDWLISRQRYWGAPIPIIFCDDCGEVPVPEADLPVVHPHIEDYVPKGKSPLANAEDFVNVDCPTCGKPAKREVDTMDTFVCSSWYFLRYPDSANTEMPWTEDRVNRWAPVDMYIGGPEHACMHLLYARFIHRVMYDLGLVNSKEPFKRLVHQGMVTKDGSKMSKSKGNVVSPDEFVSKYGSDVFRMYLMFMGPFTDGGDWNDKGITGVARFVDRFWRMMAIDGDAPNAVVHKAVDKASKAIEKMHFNIAIATLMELTNETLKTGMRADQKDLVVRVLAPLAPHLAEEIWESLGNKKSIFLSKWPSANEEFLVEDSVTFAVQVNGKLRGTLELPIDSSEADAVEAAKAIPNVIKYLEGKEVRKVVFVSGRIVGFVV